MKKIILAAMMAFSTAAFTGCAGGSLVVSERPVEPVYVRPASPNPGYVWVNGDWVESGGHYEYRHGYWSAPRNNHVWVEGSWQQRKGGWYWQKGRWR